MLTVQSEFSLCQSTHGKAIYSYAAKLSQITKFIGPTRGTPRPCRPKMGPMLATWTLLSRNVPLVVFLWSKNAPYFDFASKCASIRHSLTSSWVAQQNVSVIHRIYGQLTKSQVPVTKNFTWSCDKLIFAISDAIWARLQHWFIYTNRWSVWEKNPVSNQGSTICTTDWRNLMGQVANIDVTIPCG